MLPGLADPERTMMEVSLAVLPAAVAGLMLAAVISAILSTVSSQLLAAASAVSYDVVEGVMGRHPDDRRSLKLGRWTVAVVGLLGMLTALTEPRVVFWFVLFAWSALGASFGPLILFALTRARVNHHGALAGMLTGFGVTIAWKLGRGAAENPAAFAMVPIGTLVATALLLLVGRLARAMDGGGRFAVVTAAAVTMGAWLLIPRWGLDQLYELVPAFALAALVAPAVSRLAPAAPARPTGP
jgi:Na+/proline symporter